MRRRAVRVLVLLVTVGVTAVAGWRATTTVQERGRARLAEQQVDAAAADAIYALAELRATLHAYVAPGQGIDFWSTRGRGHIERVRTLLTGIEPAASAARHPLADAISALDRVAAVADRARTHVADGQLLVAGDIIFQDGGTLLDTITTEISAARQALARAASAREAGTANAQSLLAGGVLSVWIVALLLLVPVPGGTSRTSVDTPVSLTGRGSAPETPRGPTGLGPDDPPAELPAPVIVPTPVPAAAAAPDVAALAALCTDLGTVSDAKQLDPLLARATHLLGARGLMVWLAESSGGRLVPAVAHGYEPALVDRLGAIEREADNLTARAFRSNTSVSTRAVGDHPAALAVPIATPGGPNGVLAVELPPEGDRDLGQTAALASVLAAQLASLFPSPASSREAGQADETAPSTSAQA